MMQFVELCPENCDPDLYKRMVKLRDELCRQHYIVVDQGKVVDGNMRTLSFLRCTYEAVCILGSSSYVFSKMVAVRLDFVVRLETTDCSEIQYGIKSYC